MLIERPAGGVIEGPAGGVIEGPAGGVIERPAGGEEFVTFGLWRSWGTRCGVWVLCEGCGARVLCVKGCGARMLCMMNGCGAWGEDVTTCT